MGRNWVRRTLLPTMAGVVVLSLGGFASAGDFNGDGFTDLAIGVPGEWGGLPFHSGAINTIYGSIGGLTVDGQEFLHQDSVGVPGLSESGDLWGYALAVGDFNGDGHYDLAIGAPSEDWAGFDEGAVTVLYGTGDGLSALGSQQWGQGSTSAGTLHDTRENGDRFGLALATGDFDGDGYDDLAVGVPLEDYTGSDEGIVHVIYGTEYGLDDADNQLFLGNPECCGPVDDQAFGTTLAVGDFNMDGYDDLVVGAPDDRCVTVVAGDSAGLSYDSPGGHCFHSYSNERFGEALAVGDFNGDGCDDLAMGCPGCEFDERQDIGIVYISFNTGSGLFQSLCGFFQAIYGASAESEEYDEFGAVLSVGDFNGDGLDDLAVGTPNEGLGSGDQTGVAEIFWFTKDGCFPSAFQWLEQGVLSNGVEDDEEAMFGRALAAGVFNGDGRDDLAIGAPFEDRVGYSIDVGRVFVVYGTDGDLSTDNDYFDQCPESSTCAGECNTDEDFGFALAAVPRAKSRGLFADGFESGDTDRWSAASP